MGQIPCSTERISCYVYVYHHFYHIIFCSFSTLRDYFKYRFCVYPDFVSNRDIIEIDLRVSSDIT